MESTLFTNLSLNEEASLCGGGDVFVKTGDASANGGDGGNGGKGGKNGDGGDGGNGGDGGFANTGIVAVVFKKKKRR